MPIVIVNVYTFIIRFCVKFLWIIIIVLILHIFWPAAAQLLGLLLLHFLGGTILAVSIGYKVPR